MAVRGAASNINCNDNINPLNHQSYFLKIVCISQPCAGFFYAGMEQAKNAMVYNRGVLFAMFYTNLFHLLVSIR
jgi:hypothetical protein